MKKGSPTEFLRAFGFEGAFNGLSTTQKIDGNRIARVSLSTSNGQGKIPTHGHYVSLKAEIVDIHKGLIDSAVFAFDDHLDTAKRKDTREDYPIPGTRTYMVIDHCGWDWYIAVPKDTKPLTKAVRAYIALFGAEE